MARRVEIVTECAHGSDGDCFGCEGGSRRVLEPGEYVLLRNDAHNSTRWMGEWDEWRPIYDQLPVVTRAALAHLHGRHDEPTMHCPLCGFDNDAYADALAEGKQ